MTWIHAFELMCYGIVGIMLVDLVGRRDYDSLFTFGSAALVGFVMELLAVAVTDIYYYNPDFYLNLGVIPRQFPVFSGFMRGGLTVYGIRLAQKLGWDRVKTALAAGMFIVTMDILLDVAAIRLDGGFWVWAGREISLAIDQHTFMSVIWVNFLGYMIETPTVVWLTLRKREQVDARDWKRQTKQMFLIALKAIGVTAAGSLIALGLNALTDDWFACIAFVVLWSVLAVMLVRRCMVLRMTLDSPRRMDWPMVIFWAAMYGYCLIALGGLGIHADAPWFMAAGAAFTASTLYVAAAKEPGAKPYTIERRTILSDGKPLGLLILRPGTSAFPREKAPGILWLHGGGYATGMAGMVYMSRAMALVKKYGAVVVAPEYRLAARAPYPAGLNDCYAALRYLRDHADELGCRCDQLMVGGESAGGGLTAALCMLARDRGDIRIAFQMPLYPMLDDRDTDSSRNNHGLSWNTRRNHAAWKLYLSGLTDAPPPCAAPARQTDYAGLPPCYTFVGNREPFFCETMTYIEHLKKAGVPAQVDVYPTGFHAFDMLLPFRRISRQAAAAFEKQYAYAAEHFFAAQEGQG